MKTTIMIAALGVMTAGCAVNENAIALRESPGFLAGISDGCTTSHEEDKSFSTKSARDEEAFATDPAYRSGWRQGYLECNHRTRDAIDGGRILGERNEY